MNPMERYDPLGAVRPELNPRFMDQFYQLAMNHEAIRREWEEEQAHEPCTDPELARKLAAIRTELLGRRFGQPHDE